jgi:hypothetical protein
MYWHNLILLTISTCCSKLGEAWNKYTEKSASSWSLTTIYMIFTASANSWQILRANAPHLTPKPLSDIRWKRWVQTVKPICYQTCNIRNAMLEDATNSDHPKTKSKAKSLANNKLQYLNSLQQLLYARTFSSSDMSLDVIPVQIRDLLTFCRSYLSWGCSNRYSLCNRHTIKIQKTVY